MTNKQSLSVWVLWSSRIIGGLILAFLLFFLLAHVFGDSEGGNGFQSLREILAFICFPIGAIIGLGIGLKWQGLGGTFSLGCMLIFFMLMPETISNPYMLTVVLVAVLFLVYWYMKKRP